MQIINEEQLDFSDVLIRPARSSLNSRKDVDLYRTFEYGDGRSVTCIPIVGANMGTIGTLNMASVLSKHGYMCALEKHYDANAICGLYKSLGTEYSKHIMLSIGVQESCSVIKEVISRGYDIMGINIDVPNGYIPKLRSRVKKIREIAPNSLIVAGTVVTEDMAYDLISAGADVIRAGIGQGSACMTRIKTGVGRPQFSTVVEVANACHQCKKYCMCDGGMTCPGDICKALCAGADMCMTGALFAGCLESGGNLVEKNGKKYKEYYGMSSDLAQERLFGGVRQYRTSEGREKLVPYTGTVADAVRDINGGIASCMTYIGATEIKHMPRHAAFYRVHNQVNTKFADCENIG